MGSSTAHVLRDKEPVTIPANEVVAGDVLLLAPGDRVTADARVLSSQGLEVDEAALTGESLPVPKAPDGGTDASRIVLEGSNVTTGRGRAGVVAVGRQTRMGATTAALSAEEEQQSPLGVRFSKMLRVFIPISAVGGAIVVGAGALWGKSVAALLATGATIALADSCSRQTADVVIADDDFSTLVEAFVEGRSFWRNIRRARSRGRGVSR